MKKRIGGDSFGAEVAALEHLNGMPEPVAPRLLGVDADAGLLLIEDLGPGPSLADSLLTGDRSRVRADLISYAETMGSMHAWSMGQPRDPRLGTSPWLHTVARSKDASLGVALLHVHALVVLHARRAGALEGAWRCRWRAGAMDEYQAEGCRLILD